ncbi:hypothetical protein BCR44DRAFT_42681 [Catenaria anguillulae PL171]|uniref:Uncharacterized protein n=1 Tax=Catenaria anguillulae PL171 TaxID=765915 RepID=A0A1Y2HFW1_9FUNG|nr:hypothetical protein BCR44DRAFT_42681 [Catenaria anguillulae PL171]
MNPSSSSSSSSSSHGHGHGHGRSPSYSAAGTATEHHLSAQANSNSAAGKRHPHHHTSSISSLSGIGLNNLLQPSTAGPSPSGSPSPSRFVLPSPTPSSVSLATMAMGGGGGGSGSSSSSSPRPAILHSIPHLRANSMDMDDRHNDNDDDDDTLQFTAGSGLLGGGGVGGGKTSSPIQHWLAPTPMSPYSFRLVVAGMLLVILLILLKPFSLLSSITSSPTGYTPHPLLSQPGDYFPFPPEIATHAKAKKHHQPTPQHDPALPINNDPNAATYVTVLDSPIHARSPIDAEWAHMEREQGNLERLVIGSPSPRAQPLPRKLGLIAIPAGRKAKPMVDRLVRRFGLRDFGYMIFHWDNATWHEYSWYSQVVGVRALAQTKFWFAKRYLTPDVVANYDYVWLWDDDIEPEPSFDPVAFTQALKDHHVHFAQPALTWGEHGLQGPVVKKREGDQVGRFTTFVEVMMPVVSRGAWACAWRMIPWDAKATWGVDNVWYPACGAYGYCRFAVIDKYPVRHLDTRTFENTMETNLAELRAYTQPFASLCEALEDPSREPVAWPLKVFCRWWNLRDPLFAFDSVRKMEDEDKVNVTRCPDTVDWKGVENVPWWHIR